jgi:phosphatidylglycerophosphatase A
VTAASGAARSRVGLFIATWGYVGYAPFAPGTFGSAAGLVVYALLRQWPSVGLELAVMLGLFVVGVWSASVAERVIGSTDPQPVVVDEVVGMLITLAFLPVTVWGALIGFLVFRLFDVIKPWPSRRFESLHGGLGVMADDAMAAVYANLVMRALALVLPAGWIV